MPNIFQPTITGPTAGQYGQQAMQRFGQGISSAASLMEQRRQFDENMGLAKKQFEEAQWQFEATATLGYINQVIANNHGDVGSAFVNNEALFKNNLFKDILKWSDEDIGMVSEQIREQPASLISILTNTPKYLKESESLWGPLASEAKNPDLAAFFGKKYDKAIGEKEKEATGPGGLGGTGLQPQAPSFTPQAAQTRQTPTIGPQGQAPPRTLQGPKATQAPPPSGPVPSPTPPAAASSESMGIWRQIPSIGKQNTRTIEIEGEMKKVDIPHKRFTAIAPKSLKKYEEYVRSTVDKGIESYLSPGPGYASTEEQITNGVKVLLEHFDEGEVPKASSEGAGLTLAEVDAAKEAFKSEWPRGEYGGGTFKDLTQKIIADEVSSLKKVLLPLHGRPPLGPGSAPGAPQVAGGPAPPSPTTRDLRGVLPGGTPPVQRTPAAATRSAPPKDLRDFGARTSPYPGSQAIGKFGPVGSGVGQAIPEAVAPVQARANLGATFIDTKVKAQNRSREDVARWLDTLPESFVAGETPAAKKTLAESRRAEKAAINMIVTNNDLVKARTDPAVREKMVRRFRTIMNDQQSVAALSSFFSGLSPYYTNLNEKNKLIAAGGGDLAKAFEDSKIMQSEALQLKRDELAAKLGITAMQWEIKKTEFEILKENGQISKNTKMLSFEEAKTRLANAMLLLERAQSNPDVTKGLSDYTNTLKAALELGIPLEENVLAQQTIQQMLDLMEKGGGKKLDATITKDKGLVQQFFGLFSGLFGGGATFSGSPTVTFGGDGVGEQGVSEEYKQARADALRAMGE